MRRALRLLVLTAVGVAAIAAVLWLLGRGRRKTAAPKSPLWQPPVVESGPATESAAAEHAEPAGVASDEADEPNAVASVETTAAAGQDLGNEAEDQTEVVPTTLPLDAGFAETAPQAGEAVPGAGEASDGEDAPVSEALPEEAPAMGVAPSAEPTGVESPTLPSDVITAAEDEEPVAVTPLEEHEHSADVQPLATDVAAAAEAELEPPRATMGYADATPEPPPEAAPAGPPAEADLGAARPGAPAETSPSAAGGETGQAPLAPVAPIPERSLAAEQENPAGNVSVPDEGVLAAEAVATAGLPHVVEEALADVAPQPVARFAGRDALALLDEGNVYFNVGQYSLAIERYSRAVEVDPTLTAGYYNRANARTRAGEYDAALDDYNEALRLSPADGDALNNRGMLYLYRASYEAAIQDFDAALAAEPGDTTVLVNRGLAHLHGGDSRNALRDFQLAATMDRSDAAAQFGAAQAAAMLANRDEALSRLRRALELDPEYAREAAGSPKLVSLQGDPEFMKLLREAGSRVTGP